jgi:hypothetical protein
MPLLKGASFFGPWGSTKNPIAQPGPRVEDVYLFVGWLWVVGCELFWMQLTTHYQQPTTNN